MEKYLNTDKLSNELRRKAVDLENKKFLMANFRESKQESDLSLPVNCRGFGRIHHFRQQINSKWILDPFAVCNFHCWYCFVDDNLRSANQKFSEFVSAKQLFQWMIDESVESRVIDLSGGQPDLVPEYPLWFLQARARLGLDSTHYIWMDDNLSTDYMWRYLNDNDIEYMVRAKGFSRVGCLKGFDSESFAFNTGADGRLFNRQIELLSLLVKAGFDQYGYIIFTTLNREGLKSKIARLLDKIQNSIHKNFPLRLVPLHVFKFNANAKRYVKQAETNQFYVLDVWQAEMQNRFNISQLATPISEVVIK